MNGEDGRSRRRALEDRLGLPGRPKTGKPIYPIPEVKVPQDPAQKTSPTQPEPTMEPFSPIEATPEAVEKAEEAVASDKPKPKIVGSKIFTPHELGPDRDQPGAELGGRRRQLAAVLLRPGKEHVLRLLAGGALGPDRPARTAEVHRRRNVHRLRHDRLDRASTPKASSPPTTCRPARSNGRTNSRESCYSGAVTTAGGLLFVGQNNGELVAFDTETGEELWSFQTGAGANTTVTPFEDEGEEKIAIYAGGNSLAATAHGENFWVFSLNGTMEEAKGMEAEEEGTTHAGEETPKEAEEAEQKLEGGEEEAGGEEAAAAGAPNAEAGKEVFAEHCSVCHGANGHGGNGGPDLTDDAESQRTGRRRRTGDQRRRRHAGFKGTLSEEEIATSPPTWSEDIVGGK